MIGFSDEVKARIADYYNPHCVVWVNVVASLWGVADDHDLDEPVKLTDELACRLRFKGDAIVIDRNLSWKTTRAGTHVAARFYFRDGSFREFEIPGVSCVPRDAETVEVKS